MMHLKNGLIFISVLILALLLIGTTRGNSTVRVEGKLMNWENGSLVANSDIDVSLISNGEVLALNETTTNSDGEYEVRLNADLKEDRFYTVNVTSTKGNKKSWVKKKIKWAG